MAFSSKFLLLTSPDGNVFRVESTSMSYMILKERADGTLPAFQIKLNRPDRALLRLIYDRVSIGINIVQAQGPTISAPGYAVEYLHDPEDAESIIINGVFSLPQFVTTQRDAVWQGASNHVIAALPSLQTLSVIDEIAGTQDSQAWIQGGRSDRSLLMDVWLHSQLSRVDAAMLVGINWFGELRLAETPAPNAQAKALLTTVNDPTIRPGSATSSAPPTLLVRNTGRRFTSLSSVLGTSSSISGFDPTTGQFSTSQSQVTNTMTRGALDTSAESVGFQFAVDPDNHYPGYHAAYYSNVQKLLSLQRYSVEVSSMEAGVDLRLLDYVAYFDRSFTPAANPNIGNYVVTETRRVETAVLTERFYVLSRENVDYS